MSELPCDTLLRARKLQEELEPIHGILKEQLNRRHSDKCWIQCVVVGELVVQYYVEGREDSYWSEVTLDYFDDPDTYIQKEEDHYRSEMDRIAKELEVEGFWEKFEAKFGLPRKEKS